MAMVADDARREKLAMHRRLENPRIMGRPDTDEALHQRDSFLAERGGISSLQAGDDSDPGGDRLILEEFKRLNLVPNDADGNSAEHWGHTEAGDEDDGRAESHPHPYGRLLTHQYDDANRRYLRYHDRAIRRLDEAIRGPPASTPPPRGARVPIQRTITRRRGQRGEGMGAGVSRKPPVRMAQIFAPGTEGAMFTQRAMKQRQREKAHRGASAEQQILAGTGVLPPPPGYHYMSTGELMRDPE
jgi:hypothetical protein